MSDIMETLRYYFSLYCCECGASSELIIKINGNRFKIIRLLAENDLTFVYLLKAIDDVPYRNGNFFALKKITCPFGDIESVSEALQEIDMYKTFQNRYITSCMDSQVRQEGNGSKTVNILLPYYHFGSLQNVIDKNLLDGTYISEKECIRLMTGICKGLQYLHDPKKRPYDDVESNFNSSTIIDTTEETDALLTESPIEASTINLQDNHKISYSHKNLKPSNILVNDDHEPVIGDLSACSKALITFTKIPDIETNKEWVLSHCQLEFVAPELLQPKIGMTIDSKVDIWSLGCTLYNLMFGISPFEREEQLNGTPKRAAIQKGMFTYPQQKRYSQGLLETISRCIDINPSTRYSTKELLDQLVTLQNA
ncbi:hypothetical protein C6P45_003929 [Maudiozyma exigua]|uniref:non-specific serine/threonine protein kinase n=1 Tax=Maudiozyma exigua TaxID=34358 RepID=A0A9P7BBZ1_MAUEX|nr:hypothetical protein C6P45_003929 [Kazachstania exigua]